MRSFVFFQAEDGIRDWSVTGVQTCALPISFPGRSCWRPRNHYLCARSKRRTRTLQNEIARCLSIPVIGPLTTPFSRTGNDPVVAHLNDQAHCSSTVVPLADATACKELFA